MRTLRNLREPKARRRLVVALLGAMLIMTGLPMTQASAASVGALPTSELSRGPNEDSSQTGVESLQTGLKGEVVEERPGFRRSSDNGAEYVEVSSLRGMRDSGLGGEAKGDYLQELGYEKWSDVPTSKLDKTQNPIYYHPKVHDLPNGEDCLSKWYGDSKRIAVSERDIQKWAADVDVPGTPSGLDVNVGLNMTGGMKASAVIHYRFQTWKCDPPFDHDNKRKEKVAIQLGHMDVEVEMHVDGDFEAGGEISIAYKKELVRWVKELYSYSGHFDIYFVSVHYTFSLDVAFSVDLEARASVKASFGRVYDVKGVAIFKSRCDHSGCSSLADPVSDFDFGQQDPTDVQVQTTVDLTLTPKIDLSIGAEIELGVIGIPLFRLWDGKIGVVFQLPLRVYWTKGNNCSDANNDKVHENVESLVTDVSGQIVGYWSSRWLDGHRDHKWKGLKIPGFILKQGDQKGSIPYIERNFHFKEHRPSKNTAIQPVLGRAGRFSVINPDIRDMEEVTGVEIRGVRDCYPFNTEVRYEISWGDGSANTVVTKPRRVLHDYRNDQVGKTIKVRLLNDKAGRKLNGPWVVMDTSDSALPGKPVNLRVKKYSSKSGEIFWAAPSDASKIVGYRVTHNGKDLGVTDGRSKYFKNLPAELHVFGVQSVDRNGRRSVQANVVLDLRTGPTAPPGPQPPPSPTGKAPESPSGLVARKYSSKSGELLWNRASDSDGIVVGYRITRNGQNLGTKDALSHSVRNLASGRYNYEVRSVDNDGNESKPAKVTLVLGDSSQPQPPPESPAPPEPTPPTNGKAPNAPTNVRATRYSSSSGEVAWDRATDPDGIVVGYQITRNGKSLGQRDSLSLYQKGLSAGTYNYTITSVDNDGNKARPVSVKLTL